MRQPPPLMSSATSAYRQDARRNGGPFGAQDNDWILAVTLIEQAAMAEGERRAALLDAAVREAARLVGDAELERLARRDWGTPCDGFGALTLLGIVLHEAGASNLAAALLEAAMLAIDGADQRAHAWMLAQRARVAYQATEYDLAVECYEAIDRFGSALRIPELRARSALGLSAIAVTRGNFPEQRLHAMAALTFADAGAVIDYQRQARYSLMRNAAAGARWDEALEFGWQLVQRARGDSVEEGRALQAMAMLMLEIGDRVSARAAFSAIVTLPLPPKTHLAALGGLALTVAGHDEDRELLDWAIEQVLALRHAVVPQYAIGLALLECAIALRAADRLEESARFRDECLALSRRHGFSELIYRAGEMEGIGELADRVREQELHAQGTAAEVTGSAATRMIVVSLRSMEPAQLPEHLLLAAAPATN